VKAHIELASANRPSSPSNGRAGRDPATGAGLSQEVDDGVLDGHAQRLPGKLGRCGIDQGEDGLEALTQSLGDRGISNDIAVAVGVERWPVAAAAGNAVNNPLLVKGHCVDATGAGCLHIDSTGANGYVFWGHVHAKPAKVGGGVGHDRSDHRPRWQIADTLRPGIEAVAKQVRSAEPQRPSAPEERRRCEHAHVG
jgi:hypothetical protein